jgi:7-cyano-7-deazaguanine synthase
MEKSHDLVILLSGGYDSAVLLAMAQYMQFNPIALLVDYGQKHVVELEKARDLCETYEVEHRKMLVRLTSVNSALTGSGVHHLYTGVNEHHVPGRNTIFVGLAVSLAETVGAKKIWYGANFEDRINQFPDCYQEWVIAMNAVLRQSASYPIELEAPLLGMRKETVKALGKFLGINDEDVHSGYAVG